MIKNEFGRKIGGSKRDEWKVRGLSVSDLEDMNEAEKTAYVTKDNIWPKIDCESMMKDGIPVTVIFFIKTIRDSISKTPSLGNMERYIKSVETMRSLAEGISMESEIDLFINKCESHGFITRSYGKVYAMEKTLAEIGGRKVFNAIALGLKNCKYKIVLKKFMYSPEEVILSDYQFVVVNNPKEQFVLPSLTSDPETTNYCMRKIRNGHIALNIPYRDSQKLLNDSIIAIKGYDYVASYNSIDEAKADILTKNVGVGDKNKIQSKPRKKKFLYQQLDRMSQSNALEIMLFSKTGEDYINDFKFYGGEFGTWLSEIDRQKNLDMAYVAFKNLATALNIPMERISLGEKLSIAFGSRGRGNAMAHYEPLRKVINLTKWKGAGSLAHEYGHAIDFMLSESFGLSDGFMSTPTYQLIQYPEIAAVIKSMKANPDGGVTKYFKNSQSFDTMFSKDGGYWSSTVELFARAFACYIKDKLAEKGIKDDYLCGHAETCVSVLNGPAIKAYPEGDERKRINAAIEQMITTYLK